MLKTKLRFSHALKLTTACIALSVPALAYAQDTTETTEAADANDGTAADGEILVVAQGRVQALSEVPLAVSAVTAESLQNSGANDIRQLNQLAPSLLVSSTGTEANGSARIRGVGTVGDNPGLESSVAVFIDGVYRSRTGAGLNDLGELTVSKFCVVLRARCSVVTHRQVSSAFTPKSRRLNLAAMSKQPTAILTISDCPVVSPAHSPTRSQRVLMAYGQSVTVSTPTSMRAVTNSARSTLVIATLFAANCCSSRLMTSLSA